MTAELQDSTLGSPDRLARELVPEFEKTILQLVVDGFQRWQAEGFLRFGDHEDHFTIRLCACMKEIQRSGTSHSCQGTSMLSLRMRC